MESKSPTFDRAARDRRFNAAILASANVIDARHVFLKRRDQVELSRSYKGPWNG